MARKFETSGSGYATDILDGHTISSSDTAMTLEGTLNKTMLLLALLVGTAFAAAAFFPTQTMMYVGIGGAFITSIALGFKPNLAPTLAPIYAVSKGIVVGIASLVYASFYDGIIFQALGLTITTLVVMLLVYRSGIIPITQKFRMAVVSATMAIMSMYLIIFLANTFFGVDVSFLHSGGWLNIGLSLFIIGVAALNFLLDFDLIENGVRNRAPKFMEWFGGYTIVFTLAWIYLEFLRLLAILASND